MDGLGLEIRQLTSEDMGRLDEGRLPARASLTVARLSSRHHALARYLAAGYKVSDAAYIAGYAPSTASSLQGDPTFQELVAFYRQGEVDKLRSLQERMIGISLDAAELLAERMETDPDSISNGQLLELLKSTADRTGHGPSTTTTVNNNTSIAVRLEAAKRRLAPVIEHEVSDVSTD
jgi:hypothetical protein